MTIFTKIRKIIFAAFIFCGTVLTVQAASFSDVSIDHPNAEAIDYLSKEGVIAGYPNGSFRPDDPVNRAETLKILLLASDVPANTNRSGNFPDVADADWFAPFVFSANAREIATGYPDGFFRPEQTVNLVEALKMLFTANSVMLDNYATEEQLFADTKKRAWYNSFLFYAKTFQIVEADAANQVFPGTPLTRAQLAEVVFRFQTRVNEVCPQFLENAKTIRSNYFTGMTLTTELPNVFYEDEIFTVRGVLTSPADDVSVIFENRETGEQAQFTTVTDGQNFTVPASFTTPGSYNFTVIPSTVNSNTAVTIEVLPRECQPATVVASGTPPSNIQAALVDNEPTLTWDAAENDIFRVVIRQGDERYEKLISAKQNSLTLDPADFLDFTAGEATLQVFGAKAEQGWSFEPRSAWFGSTLTTLNLAQHHFSTFDTEKISLPSLPLYRGPRISLTGTAQTALEADAYLITPKGKVEIVPILEDAEEIPAGAQFALNLQLPEVGTYILEINAVNGIAVLNHPLYVPSEFPLLPDFDDLRERPDDDIKLSLNREKAIWLRLINDFRAQQQLPKVDLDSELSAFAQEYAEQMAAQNFFGHVDLSGNDPNARRKIFGLQLPVGENLARDIQTEYAHEGLLRSAAHRENILTAEWTRVGLGIAEASDGGLLFVQEFSTDPLSADTLDASKDELLSLINAARAERGTASLSLDGQIGSVAQSWSDKMVAENFTDFSHGNERLENSVRATGYSGNYLMYIASASKLSQIVENLSGDIFADTSKSRVAIGLAQDGDGLFRVTLVFR